MSEQPEEMQPLFINDHVITATRSEADALRFFTDKLPSMQGRITAISPKTSTNPTLYTITQNEGQHCSAKIGKVTFVPRKRISLR
tara:strand:- start:241 stop:495 length:255 start_codon:yes stop_codon:yes gene_type:complete